MSLVLEKIETQKHIRKELFLDESFEFLTGNMGQFLEKMFRQIRKHNGAISIATQTVIEINNSPVGDVIIGNAPVKILLNHNSVKNLFDITQQSLGLTNNEMAQLSSLRSEGKWRECLIKRGEETEIFVIDVGPHASKAYSTSGDDRAKMEEYSKKYSSKELIINQMVEDESQEE
jgi:type IV secretory pathway VirB4 component